VKIEAQEIVGSLSRKEGKILFTYNSHKGEITLTLPTAVQWETIKMWLEVLEDQPDTVNPPKELPEKAARWTSNKDAAKHYRVSKSTIFDWGLNGRIRRRASRKRHSRTGGPIWQYDVSHNHTNVPPKHTYSVHQ